LQDVKWITARETELAQGIEARPWQGREHRLWMPQIVQYLHFCEPLQGGTTWAGGRKTVGVGRQVVTGKTTEVMGWPHKAIKIDFLIHA
jgi:hypothetical protein